MIRKAQLVFSAVHSLTSLALEKTIAKFDTIIVDDANLVNEIDILQALKHSGVRLIMLGNHKI